MFGFRPQNSVSSISLGRQSSGRNEFTSGYDLLLIFT